MHLNAKALGLASGILAAALWLVVMGLALTTGIFQSFVLAFGPWHPYFSFSWLGLLWMMILHFVGCFILGWIFAKLYNAFVR